MSSARPTHSTPSAAAAVSHALERIRQAERDEVWIEVREAAELAREAAEIDAASGHGTELISGRIALHGRTIAVKDNIDVAGVPTTLGFPGARRIATEDATAVARLRAAGGIVIGKTNLDQFATGLVGTRSPYGAVRGSRLPHRISGGSSSGSAVAVALGLVDVALGTDTAGSGRVPAALNGIVGIKPTLGLVPARGMADACFPYDTVTAFARTLDLATLAVATMSGPDPLDPTSRRAPLDARLAAPERAVVAVPDDAGLTALTPAARVAWDAAVAHLETVAEVRTIDIQPLLDAATLLYGGAIVAGRFAAAGRFMESPAGLDPTVATIVRDAQDPAGWEYVRDLRTLAAARLAALELLDGCDGLMTPTAPGHPTVAEVSRDPIGVNAWLGTYTNFVNLLDLAAVAVPAGQLSEDGELGDFGVTFVVRPFEDQVGIDLAARFLDVPSPDLGGGTELAVFGAHLRGQPLHHELVALGARFAGEITTSPDYRLYALPTAPAKPGLVRSEGGRAIAGELWRLSPGSLGNFLAALPAPMTLGTVSLADGREVVGFGCDASALAGAEEITRYGGWPAYLAAQRAV